MRQNIGFNYLRRRRNRRNVVSSRILSGQIGQAYKRQRVYPKCRDAHQKAKDY